MQVNNVKPYQSMKRGIWLARDKKGALYAYNTRPIVDEQAEMFIPTGPYYNALKMQHSNVVHKRFPEVTWENSPVFAELDLML